MSKKLWIVIASGLVALALLLSPISPILFSQDALAPQGATRPTAERPFSVGEILDPTGNPFAHTFSDTKDIRTATYVVAASDSEHKYMADFRCDGVADQVQIQAAIDALNAANGGCVQLLSGNYNISVAITIYGGITLQGENMYTTKLNQDAAINVIECSGVGTHYFTTIRDLFIEGDDVTYGSGSGIYNSGETFNDVILERLFITHFPDYGIYTTVFWGWKIFEVVAEWNNDNLRINGGGNGSIIASKFLSSGRYGMYFTNAWNLRILGNIIGSSGTRGIQGNPLKYSHIIGNTFSDNTGYDICFETSGTACEENEIIGNFLGSDTAAYSILGGSGQHRNIVRGNHCAKPIRLDEPSNVFTDQHYDTFEDVLASSANYIVNAQNLVNGAVALTGTQPKYPRGLDCTITNVGGAVSAYTMTVVGTNAKGQTITEVFTFADDGLAFSSDNAFDHITSVTLADVVDTGNATFVMGIDGRLGLMNVIYKTSDVWKITKNLTKQTVAAAQVNTTYDTYDMSVITLAATDDFVIWYRSNLNIIS